MIVCGPDDLEYADELDIFVCRAVEATDATLTVVGDPWQALYDWRGATPDKVDSKLIAVHPFTPYDLLHSFRFANDKTVELATNLRAGEHSPFRRRQVQPSTCRPRSALGNTVDRRRERPAARVPDD
jgi:hypothetical protein